MTHSGELSTPILDFARRHALAAALFALLIATPAIAAAQEEPAREPQAVIDAKAAAEDAAQAAPDAPVDGRARLAEVHDFLSRDGGRWRAKNPPHAPGAPTPAEFGYEFDWVLDGAAVATRIFALYEDGRDETLWQALTSWHAGDRQVAIYSLSREGDVARGTYEVIDDTHHRIHLTVTGADGESLLIRDDLEILGPDHFRSTTSMRREGEWAVLEVHEWRRVGSGGN